MADRPDLFRRLRDLPVAVGRGYSTLSTPTRLTTATAHALHDA